MPAHIDTEPLFIPPKPDEANPLKWCKRCEHFMPLKNFDALLTRAQMKARGYAGKVRMPFSSSKCKDCRPKGKAHIKKTPTQLQRLAHSGELTQNHVDLLVDTKRLLRKDNHRRSAVRRWAREHFQPLMDVYQAENLWVISALHRFKKSPPKTHAYATRTAGMVAFLERYHAVLSDIAINLKAHRAQALKGNKGENPTTDDSKPYPHLRDYTTPAVISELRGLWADIPDNIYRHAVVLFEEDL